MEDKAKEFRNLMNEMDIYQTKDFNDVALLLEERGVASVPYKQVIKKMADYTVNEFNNNPDTLEVYIPEQMTKPINFVEDLTIAIDFIEFNGEEKDAYGGGSTTTSIFGEMNQHHKLDWAIIKVHAYYAYINGIKTLLQRSLYNNLCHELHHAKMYYIGLSRTKYIGNTRQGKRVTQINLVTNYLSQNLTSIGSNSKNILNSMVYRLFNEHETNALCDGVYGDLQGFNSQRENFRNDIKKTQAYNVYRDVSLEYKDIINRLSDDDVTLLYKTLLDNNLIGQSKIESIGAIRYQIMKTIKHKLKMLILKIGKVASLWYDNSEETVELNEQYNKNNGLITIE